MEYLNSSPMTYANQIQSPVLLMAGRNDTHSTTRQVAVFEEKMKQSGQPIKVAWYEGGHEGPVTQTDEQLYFQELMLEFAFKSRSIRRTGPQTHSPA